MDGAGASVLLVEDDELVAEALRRQLERGQFSVVGVVSDAALVISAVQSLRPDVVLMDIHLGTSLDGITVAEEILVCEDIPVVFLSGALDETERQRATRCGAYGFVLKPASWEAIATVLEMAVSRHAQLGAQAASVRILNQALDSLDDSVIVLRGLGDVEFMNSTACTLLGWTLSEAKLKRPAWVSQLDPLSVHGETSVTLQRRSGELVVCSMRTRGVSDGNRVYILRPVRAEPPS